MSKQIWNFWASKYEKLWVQKFSLTPTREAVIRTINKYTLQNQNKILDIGCGTGQLLNDIANKFENRNLNLLGIDFSEEMISIAKKQNKNAKFIAMDVSNLPDLDEKFDIIVCTHSLPYYKNQVKAISDMADKLNENGIIILAHGSKNSFYDALSLGIVKLTTGKAKYPSMADIIKFCDRKLKILEIHKLDSPVFVPTILVTVFKRRKK